MILSMYFRDATISRQTYTQGGQLSSCSEDRELPRKQDSRLKRAYQFSPPPSSVPVQCASPVCRGESGAMPTLAWACPPNGDYPPVAAVIDPPPTRGRGRNGKPLYLSYDIEQVQARKAVARVATKAPVGPFFWILPVVGPMFF